MSGNCWDMKDCGRGPGGRLVGELGECPVVKAVGSKEENGPDQKCWKVRIKDEKGRLVPNWSRPEKECLNCEVMDITREKE